MKYPSSVWATAIVASMVISACTGSSDSDSSGNAPATVDTPDTSGPPSNGQTQDDNVAPLVGSFSANPTDTQTGEPLEFSWSVSDSDDEPLRCTLDVDTDGAAEYTFVDCESVLMQSHIYDVPGSFTATLRVTDPAGGSASSTTDIVVTGTVSSTVPTISSFSATPASVAINTPTELAWTIADPSGNGVSCTIDVDNDGTMEYGITDCSTELSVSHTYSEVGDYTVLIVATNSAGESRERTTAVSVTEAEVMVDGDNNEPVIVSYLVDSSSVMIEEPVMFTWSATDPDLDVVQCSIDFDGDGNADFQQTGCDTDTVVSHIYGFPGSYDAVLTIDDGRGGIASEVRTISVVPVTFKLSADGPVVPGGFLRYTYTFSNVSLTPVDNVRVLFRTPTGLSYNGRADASPDASCSRCDEDTEASWTFASMDAGESRTIEILARVSENIVPDSIIRATVSVTADAISGSINRRMETPVTPRRSADLRLSASADALIAGDLLTMTADVGNLSNDSLGDINLQMTLPEGSTVSNISDGGMQDENGTVTWAIGTLPVLESVSRQVTFGLSNDAIPGQIKMTSATVSGTGSDRVDSSAMLPISISEDRSQLQVEVAAINELVDAGGSVRYQISVGNRALVPASNVQVLMRTPSGLSYNGRSDATPDASCSRCSEGVEAIWSLGNIPAGESRVIELNAAVSADLQAGSLIQASILAAADTLGDTINVFDVVAVDNRDSSTVAFSTPIDGYMASDTVDITTHIGNASTGFLEGVSLGVSLPAGATFISATDAGVHDATLNEVNWNVDSVPVLTTAQRTVSFSLSGDALPGELAPLAARVSHDGGPEIDAATNYRVNIVETVSPLEVTVATDEASAMLGQRLRYTVTLKNNAFVPLNDVGIVYRVPPGLSFNGRSDVEPDASCSRCTSGIEAAWLFNSIPAGETRIIDINAAVSTDIQAGNLLVAPFVIRATNLSNDVSVNSVTSVTQ
ncbi:MAG: PKD domain-containing protein [Granulosicoccus sp.]